jgi:hypothetical protein
LYSKKIYGFGRRDQQKASLLPALEEQTASELGSIGSYLPCLLISCWGNNGSEKSGKMGRGG